MPDRNPYEPLTVSPRGQHQSGFPNVMSPYLWSLGCFLIGAGLSWGLPMLLVYSGLWKPKGMQDFDGWVIILISFYASIVSGVTGLVAGLLQPGRQAILATISCVVLTDLLSIAFCSLVAWGSQFYLLYLVSAFSKVVAMKLIASRDKTQWQVAISITGAFLLVCIVTKFFVA